MGELNTEGTNSTPTIITNSAAVSVEICGKSYPKNTFEFYQPLIDWIEGHLGRKVQN